MQRLVNRPRPALKRPRSAAAGPRDGGLLQPRGNSRGPARPPGELPGGSPR